MDEILERKIQQELQKKENLLKIARDKKRRNNSDVGVPKEKRINFNSFIVIKGTTKVSHGG